MKVPLEKQVSSLEPSKRLVELGVRVESYFHWERHSVVRTESQEVYDAGIPAWTVAELFAHIPFHVDVCRICDDKYRATVWPDKGDYWVCETGLANTLVEILIWLIKHNHVTVEEINGGD
jgi:hypothetical protein